MNIGARPCKKCKPKRSIWFVFFKEPTNETCEDCNSDTDNKTSDAEPKMKFDALKGRAPNEQWYDLPYGLYEILRSGQMPKIHRKLKKFVPKELNYGTYKKRFHAHVFLEEIEMQISFEKYRSREISIDAENQRFAIMCSKITELRPPIAVGECNNLVLFWFQSWAFLCSQKNAVHFILFVCLFVTHRWSNCSTKTQQPLVLLPWVCRASETKSFHFEIPRWFC